MWPSGIGQWFSLKGTVNLAKRILAPPSQLVPGFDISYRTSPFSLFETAAQPAAS